MSDGTPPANDSTRPATDATPADKRGPGKLNSGCLLAVVGWHIGPLLLVYGMHEMSMRDWPIAMSWVTVIVPMLIVLPPWLFLMGAWLSGRDATLSASGASATDGDDEMSQANRRLSVSHPDATRRLTARLERGNVPTVERMVLRVLITAAAAGPVVALVQLINSPDLHLVVAWVVAHAWLATMAGAWLLLAIIPDRMKPPIVTVGTTPQPDALASQDPPAGDAADAGDGKGDGKGKPKAAELGLGCVSFGYALLAGVMCFALAHMMRPFGPDANVAAVSVSIGAAVAAAGLAIAANMLGGLGLISLAVGAAGWFVGSGPVADWLVEHHYTAPGLCGVLAAWLMSVVAMMMPGGKPGSRPLATRVIGTLIYTAMMLAVLYAQQSLRS